MIENKEFEGGKISLECADGEIDISNIFFLIADNKRFILLTGLLCALLAAGVAYMMPNKYIAKAQILPPQSQSGSSALLGQLGALSGLAGGSGGLKNPNDIYMGMLNSRTVADNMVRRFQLLSVYEKKFGIDARNELKKASNIESGKDGLISIEVEDTDPKRAAAMSNGYIEELQKLTQTLAVTDAAQRRIFFDKQLQQTKAALVDAEVALKQVQEKTGLIRLNEQAEGIIKAASEIKGQIAAKEVALGSMRTFATTNNPEYIRMQQDIVGLKAQLQKIETGMNAGRGDISISTSSVPEVALDYIRRVRDVKYQETIFDMLAKQLEIAKVDEAKEGSILQVLDKATVPEKKSKPGRTIIVIFAGLGGLFLAISWIFIQIAFGNFRMNYIKLKNNKSKLI